MFETIQAGPVDPMFILKKSADSDPSPSKIDLGVGIYQSASGGYYECDVVKKAKKILDFKSLGHDYELTTGNPQFLRHAQNIMFGTSNTALKEGRIASVQAISGTGANHLAGLLLARAGNPPVKSVYLGVPAWGNYEPLCKLLGIEVKTYQHYDKATNALDFNTLLKTLREAPEKSVFILQGCCHNPTGMDFSREQWVQIADKMEKRGHIPWVDIAYQGLAEGIDEDAYGTRLLVERGFEMIVCQSFSKNFGLYGERCGVLHAVAKSEDVAVKVKDQLRSLIRWEFSSSPAFGARLVSIVADDEKLRGEWEKELVTIQQRLRGNRERLHQLLVQNQTPGNWDMILATKGLFW
jgi:aspartate aminotransferase, cytoplasmic